SAKRAQPSSRWPMVLIGLVGMVALPLLGVVIYISLPGGEGTVRVETVDPDIEVTVKQGGKAFTVYDAKTKKSGTLPVGKYQVERKGGRAGLELETNVLTLRGGKEAVVHVRWEKGKGPPIDAQARRQEPDKGKAPPQAVAAARDFIINRWPTLTTS